MRPRFIYSLLFLIAIFMFLISCATKGVRKVEEPSYEKIVMIDNTTFAKEVEQFDGFALVFFYNEKFWQSRDMEKRFEYFADQFYKNAKFCKFHWAVNADAKLYRLKMLPTTVLYKDGAEIDRIKGIPPDKNARMKWNSDIELWILKNVLGLEGDEYAGKFKYLFRNGYKLHISNY